MLGRIGGDANLSPRGKKYAKSLARHTNEVLNIDGLRVWTSELRRTKQTAEDIDAPKEHIAALNELDAVSKIILIVFLQYGNLYSFFLFLKFEDHNMIYR